MQIFFSLQNIQAKKIAEYVQKSLQNGFIKSFGYIYESILIYHFFSIILSAFSLSSDQFCSMVKVFFSFLFNGCNKMKIVDEIHHIYACKWEYFFEI